MDLHGYSQALLQTGKPVFCGPEQGSGVVKLKSHVLQFAAFAAPATTPVLHGWPGNTCPSTALTEQVSWELCKRSKQKMVVTANIFCSVQ